MTKIIGLTGGIGSGKTTVAHYFRELGIPVYIADDEARKITEKPEILKSIRQAFGDAVFEKGKLSREKLAAIVFNNPQKLEMLNKIIHPAVKEDFKEWILRHQNHPILIKETAILFESGNDKDCNAIISVIAPVALRIERVVQRDGSTPESVKKRMESQWTDAQRAAQSDYIIENVDLSKTKQQVKEILKKLQNF